MTAVVGTARRRYFTDTDTDDSTARAVADVAIVDDSVEWPVQTRQLETVFRARGPARRRTESPDSDSLAVQRLRQSPHQRGILSRQTRRQIRERVVLRSSQRDQDHVLVQQLCRQEAVRATTLAKLQRRWEHDTTRLRHELQGFVAESIAALREWQARASSSATTETPEEYEQQQNQQRQERSVSWHDTKEREARRRINVSDSSDSGVDDALCRATRRVLGPRAQRRVSNLADASSRRRSHSPLKLQAEQLLTSRRVVEPPIAESLGVDSSITMQARLLDTRLHANLSAADTSMSGQDSSRSGNHHRIRDLVSLANASGPGYRSLRSRGDSSDHEGGDEYARLHHHHYHHSRREASVSESLQHGMEEISHYASVFRKAKRHQAEIYALQRRTASLDTSRASTQQRRREASAGRRSYRKDIVERGGIATTQRRRSASPGEGSSSSDW